MVSPIIFTRLKIQQIGFSVVYSIHVNRVFMDAGEIDIPNLTRPNCARAYVKMDLLKKPNDSGYIFRG